MRRANHCGKALIGQSEIVSKSPRTPEQALIFLAPQWLAYFRDYSFAKTFYNGSCFRRRNNKFVHVKRPFPFLKLLLFPNHVRFCSCTIN
jgi:hypothetical protein